MTTKAMTCAAPLTKEDADAAILRFVEALARSHAAADYRAAHAPVPKILDPFERRRA